MFDLPLEVWQSQEMKTNLWRLLSIDLYRCHCQIVFHAYFSTWSFHDKNFDLASVDIINYLSFQNTHTHAHTFGTFLSTSLYLFKHQVEIYIYIIYIFYIYALITGNNWFSTINCGSACSLLVWWVPWFNWSRWTCTWCFWTFTSRGIPFSLPQYSWGVPLC